MFIDMLIISIGLIMTWIFVPTVRVIGCLGYLCCLVVFVVRGSCKWDGVGTRGEGE